jgi:hypothetical protein
MEKPDLRILSLADAKVLPADVQQQFDQWRIRKARDVVTSIVRRRMSSAPKSDLATVQLYLERLEIADTDQTIFEGIYALAEVVEVHRQVLGTHSQHLVLIMSQYLNPWGVIDFQRDFASPAPNIVAAAAELWRLAQEYNLDVQNILSQMPKNELTEALDSYYAAHPEAITPLYHNEKMSLNTLLNESYVATVAAAKLLTSDRVIYSESGWRVKDIIAHLMAWEAEGITSLRAYQEGKQYKVTDNGFASDADFNDKQYQKYKDLPVEQIYQEWAAVIERLKTAINDTPPGKFEGKMLCPWGALGTVSHLIEELTKHDKEHREEILRVARKGDSL